MKINVAHYFFIFYHTVFNKGHNVVFQCLSNLQHCMMGSSRVFIFCIFVFTFVSKSETQEIQLEETPPEESILEFEICPQFHPYQTEEGKVCCSGQPSLTEWCGEAVDCTSSWCEDFHSPCGGTWFTYENLSPEYDETYFYFSKILKANHPIFKKDGKCIWWHQPFRYWWIGPCENVGSNTGFEYIEDDAGCPGSTNWRRSESDELIPNIQISVTQVAEKSGRVESDDQTGNAAVSIVISNGRYQQKCRFKYINGSYRCNKQK